MKIKTKNSSNNSSKLIVPLDGLITIDANGIADVSAKCAVILVTGTNDWEYLTKNSGTEQTSNDDNSETEQVSNDNDNLEVKLNSMKLDELKQMAKEGELPEEEFSSITTKKAMIEYLLRSLKK